MGGPYSALTKRENPDGTLTITDTINNTSHVYTKDEWDDPSIDKGAGDGPNPIDRGKPGDKKKRR